MKTRVVDRIACGTRFSKAHKISALEKPKPGITEHNFGSRSRHLFFALAASLFLSGGCATTGPEPDENQVYHPMEYLSEALARPEDPRFAPKRPFRQEWETGGIDPGFWDTDERFFSTLNP